MIKCLIADDEVIAHQILEQYILRTEGLVLVGKSRNAMEAFAKVEQNRPDLIFLDIDMPLVNGITFLKSLTSPPKVIFTTAHAEYALQGYDLNVADYLLKPFSYERFEQAVNKVKDQLQHTMPPQALAGNASVDFLSVKEKEGWLRIPFATILYIEGSRDYVKVVTAQRTYLVYQRMKNLEEELPSSLFVRTHKSFIVNLSAIRVMRTAELVLTGDQLVPVSSHYKEQVAAAFKGSTD
ncbi:MAG: response regulator transcription factor [Chitinophagaceae bacterium]|nr:response regulator transcription factor [Chitinophagaceae bacterium]